MPNLKLQTVKFKNPTKTMWNAAQYRAQATPERARFFDQTTKLMAWSHLVRQHVRQPHYDKEPLFYWLAPPARDLRHLTELPETKDRGRSKSHREAVAEWIAHIVTGTKTSKLDEGVPVGYVGSSLPMVVEGYLSRMPGELNVVVTRQSRSRTLETVFYLEEARRKVTLLIEKSDWNGWVKIKRGFIEQSSVDEVMEFVERSTREPKSRFWAGVGEVGWVVSGAAMVFGLMSFAIGIFDWPTDSYYYAGLFSGLYGLKTATVKYLFSREKAKIRALAAEYPTLYKEFPNYPTEDAVG
ncbi:hypothetical protein ACFL5U_00465 [Candidatus Margulisiibacteriota bacterium]